MAKTETSTNPGHIKPGKDKLKVDATGAINQHRRMAMGENVTGQDIASNAASSAGKKSTPSTTKRY